MSFSGRIVGGILVAIALVWLLSLAGVFPFNKNRTAGNPISNAEMASDTDRPPLSDLNAPRNSSTNKLDTQSPSASPDSFATTAPATSAPTVSETLPANSTSQVTGTPDRNPDVKTPISPGGMVGGSGTAGGGVADRSSNPQPVPQSTANPGVDQGNVTLYPQPSEAAPAVRAAW